MTRHPRTINFAALGWTAVAALAVMVAILLVPLAWHLTVALWTSGAAWWLAAVAAVLTIGGLLLTGYTYRDRIAELEAEAERRDREHEADLAAAETERDIAHALVEQWRRDARVVRPLPRLQVVPEQRQPSDSWLERVMDEQAETWPTDGGA